MAWLSIITGVLQIFSMVLKNKFEQDAAERSRKDDLHKEWIEVAKSGDISRINAFIVKLRS